MNEISVGIPEVFFIRSAISTAYKEDSFMALGFFQIIVNGEEYGRRSADATLLSCSFNEVSRRIEHRGTHVSSYMSADAENIAGSYIKAVLLDSGVDERFFDMSKAELLDSFYSGGVLWAPDGDAAFDDGAVVFQFDIGENVRIVSFRRGEWGIMALQDIKISSVDFYKTLERWSVAFLKEREMKLKVQGYTEMGE